MNHLYAQQDPYAAEWRKADSLFDSGLPQSAEKVIRDVYRKAQATKQEVQMLKAQLYLLKATTAYQENADSVRIAFALQEAATAAFPYNAIWNSLTAQLYWDYYRQNRWQILQRSRVADNEEDDFSFWSADRFYREVTVHYLRSLHDSKKLQQINIATIDPLLIKGENTEHLRPSLYDLLVFRAIGFFQDEEKDITRPAYHFTINDPASFLPADQFVQYKFTTTDTAALHFQALKLYQDASAFHAGDEIPAALIDADLQRLQFVYKYSVLPDKKDLYLKALESLAARYPEEPAAAMASFRVAEILAAEEYSNYPGFKKQAQRNLKDVRTKLEQIIIRFPKSEAAILAHGKLGDITRHQLNLQTEEVVLPGAPSRILLTYRNISKVYLKVVQLDCDSGLRKLEQNDEAYTKILLSRVPVVSWSESLPGMDDMEMHTTEIKVDALSQGCYAVIVSEQKDPALAGQEVFVTGFQVSEISFVTLSHGGNSGVAGYVLNRKTGAPMPGARLVFYEQEYNRKTQGYDYRQTGTAVSDADGSFRMNGKYSVRVVVRHKDDVLYQGGYFSGSRQPAEHKKQTHTFFFTDRSIYRPGQTIWFKGIMVTVDSNGRSNRVITGQPTEVSFFDVNGQVVHKLQLTGNEYGAVHGSFIAPESGLAGQMRIGNISGDCYVSVEAYKRPKFQVLFDTLKTAYSLNETVSVRVNAQAFAGNPVDGATVNYRVVRATRYPYRWMFYGFDFPRTAEVEMLNGSVVTGGDGRAEISFKALPDPTVDTAAQPVFTYTVYADVTDLNGETRSAAFPMSVGYRTLQIVASVPDKAQPHQLDTIKLTTQSLNGDFVPAQVRLRIYPLSAPSVYYRNRLWSQPDQYVMDEETFRKYFPRDVYKDEHNPVNWKHDQVAVFDQSWRTTAHGKVNIPESVWKRGGWYLLESEAVDKSGRVVREKKYVEVFDPNSQGYGPYAKITVQNGQSWQPGQQAHVWLASGIADMHWIRYSQSSANPQLNVVQTTPKKSSEWKAVVSEQDRGGISLYWIAVRENRVYEESVFLPVPWKNKELDIAWETHRDKLEPGAKETWTLTVRGDKKEVVAAEMAAALYDASLDMFKPHGWSFSGLYPQNYKYVNWGKYGFGAASGISVGGRTEVAPEIFTKRYDRLMEITSRYYYGYRTRGVASKVMSAAPKLMANREEVLSDQAAESEAVQQEALVSLAAGNAGEASAPPQTDVRTNLNETAFFFPDIKTDKDGNIRMSFTMPEALTEWKLLSVAHTPDMKIGTFEGRVKTQKDLMVTPGLPRFFRQGDKMIISSKISNLTDDVLNGTAWLMLTDAFTGKELTLPFRLQQTDQPFRVGPGGSASVSWEVYVPESLYQPVTVRISARAGNFTDGESHILPVVSNRMMVTETTPLWINGYGTKSFRFDKLLQSGGSNTLAQHRVTVEFTGNPAWYVVQALPYLAEYPHECAEQIFNRYYANALAGHIVNKAPGVKKVFDEWKTADTMALLSDLEKNQELKTALLEETPWLLEAQNETEQKKRIALLFETHKLSRNLDAAVAKLNKMILPEGAFPWFSGSNHPDRYITQYITTGIGRLRHLGVHTRQSEGIVTQTTSWLDRQILEDYKRLQRSKAKLDDQQVGVLQIQYLYMRSFFTDRQIQDKETKAAVDYYKKQAAKYWSSFNAYMKGMIALSLHRDGDVQIASVILQSLRETAIRNEEMGIYWLQTGRSWWWHEAPVEAQALLVECFAEVARDTEYIDGMRRWLLKQKQTQNWHTTKATADACYAFLLQGTQWLTYAPEVTIRLGAEEISSTAQKQEAGSGYFKTAYGREQIVPDMGNITISTAPGKDQGKDVPSGIASYGAVYWQYFENLEEITPAAHSLEIRKQLFVTRSTDKGPVLELVTEKTKLRVGDKLISRIEIISDRDMEYVHLKDMRGAGFEPVNVLSGYRWQGGLGYYESTGDISSNFFISYLRKGKYVFEYPMFVTNKGSFSVGIATLQCMYAPEFSSHSKGLRVQVE